MRSDIETPLENLRRYERWKEDAYFHARDREVLDRLHVMREKERRVRLRDLIRGRCPECAAYLVRASHHDVTIEECPLGHGMWMTESEARTLARRERNSWIGRYLYRLRPIV